MSDMEASYGDCCCANESFFSATSLLDCQLLCPQAKAHQNSCQEFCTEECDFALFEQRGLKAVKDVATNLQRQSLFRTFDPLCCSSCATSQSELPVTNASVHESEVSRAQAESQSGARPNSKATTNDVANDSANLFDSFATLKSPTLTAGFNASTFNRLRLSSNVLATDSGSALRTADSRSSIGRTSPAGSMLGDDSRVRVYVTHSPTLANSSQRQNATQFLLPPLADSLCSSLSSPQLNKTGEHDKSHLVRNESSDKRRSTQPKTIGRSPSDCDKDTARRILARRMPLSLASSPLQDAARQLAHDIEQYLIVARARLAGNEPPKSPSNLNEKQVAVDENRNARQLEDSDNDSTFDDAPSNDYAVKHNSLNVHAQSTNCEHEAKRTDIPLICVVQTQTNDQKLSDYQHLVQLERTRLQAQYQANEMKRKELEGIGSTLSEQLATVKRDNEELANLVRAQDRQLQLAGKLQRRNQTRLAEALQEKHQMTTAFGEAMKLESTAEMTISYYRRFDERAKSTKMHLEEALKKMVEACERLSNYTQAKQAQLDRKRAYLQREAETQRSHLQSAVVKLRTETDDLKCALTVKVNEVTELKQFIANLNATLGERRSSS